MTHMDSVRMKDLIFTSNGTLHECRPKFLGATSFGLAPQPANYADNAFA